MPSTFNFRWDVNRHYGELKVRDVNACSTRGIRQFNSGVVRQKLYDEQAVCYQLDITRAEV